MSLSICKKQRKNCGNMSLNKKSFIYYCRVNVSEGLNTELSTSQLMLEKYDRKCTRIVDTVVV